MIERPLKHLRVPALLILILQNAANAQSTFATLTGTVTDQSGAVAPAVSISGTNRQTGYSYNTKSNESGQYTLANLVEGTYSIVASAPGFREYRVDDVILTPRDVRRIDVQLSVGEVGTRVEVSGGASLIETESARISETMNNIALRNMPLTLRRAWDYFTLAPQVSFQRNGFQMRFAGSRNNQAEVTIDGSSIARSGGGFASGPLLDRTESFQEMRLDIANTGAEFSTMGQVSMISRGGTNLFHGIVSDYYTTPAFAARDPFSSSTTQNVSHRFTFSAGGPIVIPKLYNGKNRTFVHGTIEVGSGSGTIAQINQSAPLEAWRRGDFSALNTPVTDPFNNNQPFPGNIIPANRINPVTKAIQDRFYSLPNFGNGAAFAAQNYRETRQNTVAHQPTYTLRVDHRFSDKIFVYGRLTRVDWNLDGFETIPLLSDRRYLRRNLRAATIAYTHTISPGLLNEFRWGYSFDELPTASLINGKQFTENLGLRGLAPNLPEDAGGILRVAFDGLGVSPLTVASTCIPCSRDRINTWTDNLTWTRGAHSMKIGGTLFRGQSNEIRQPDALFGDVRFSNRFTGFPYADFLLGIPSTLSRGFPTIEPRRYNWTYAAYINDEWKAAPRLTVSLGVRYQLYTGWKEESGRQAIFDVATGSIVVPDGALSQVSPLIPKSYVNVMEASKAGYNSSTLLTPDKNNFAPRVGLAWRPTGSNNTVLRAGFGIFYDTAPQGPSAGQTSPFYLSEPAYTNPVDRPIVLPQVFPETGSGGPTAINLPLAMRRDLRVPLSMNYSFTAERQWGNNAVRLSYVGTNTRQGVWRRDFNQPIADGSLYVDKPRPFPQYPAIPFSDNGAGHQYHGATVTFERLYKNGLQFRTYYTLARDIGDLENNETSEDAYNRGRERAAWGDLPTHRFNGSIVYELPVGKGKALGASMNRFVNSLFGNWIVSSIYTYESGAFITPLWTGPDPTGTRFTTSRTRPIVTIRPDGLRDSNIDDPTVNRWFDPTAFAAPSTGRFGTSAKGVIKSVPTNVLHSTLAKEFFLGERTRLRLEFLGSNVLNHPNYQDPNTDIAAVGLTGVITRVQDRNTKMDSPIPRIMQVQLRLEW